MNNRLVLWSVLLAVLPLYAEAKLLKCVDSRGVTIYYDGLPPPECQGRATTEMSNRGIVTKRGESAATPEQIKAKEEEEARRQEAERQRMEQRRRDSALINTYTGPEEIDRRRDRELQQAEQALATLNANLKNTQARLDGLRKQADTFAQSKKPLPAAVKADLAKAEEDKKNQEAEIVKKKEQIEKIRLRYGEDKKRFLELKGGKSR